MAAKYSMGAARMVSTMYSSHTAITRRAVSRPVLTQRTSLVQKSVPMRYLATNRDFPQRCHVVEARKDSKKERRERRSQQQAMQGTAKGERVQDKVAASLGIPVKMVEAGFVVAGASLAISLGLSVLATLAVPAMITAVMVLPALFAVLGLVIASGAVISSLLPVLVIAGGFATAGIFTGLVIPATMMAALGFAFVFFLGGGKVQTEEVDGSQPQAVGKDGVVDVEAKKVKPPKSEDELEAERLRQELDEFDRRLLGDPKKWSVAEVGLWLSKAGYSDELVATFGENHIDGPTLLALDSDDLRVELGISALTNRKEMLRKIADLRG